MHHIPVNNGEIECHFDQPKREWSGRLSRPTVNLFLYDIRENNILRQHQWQTELANGASHTIKKKRTPYRLDCHYMLTAWASEPNDEHRLLTRCLLALFRNPIFPEDELFGALQNQPFAIPIRLATHDKLTNPAELWSALDNELRPSISCVITISLDPWEMVEAGGIVKEFTLEMDEIKR